MPRRNPRRTAFAALVVVIAGAGLWVVLRNGQGPPGEGPPPAPRVESARLSEIEDRLQEIRARLDGLAAQQSASARAQDELADALESIAARLETIGASLPSGSDPREAADETAETAPAPEEDVQQVVAALGSRLAEEAVDPSWSAEATDQLHRATEQIEDLATEPSRVECRSTLCRVETHHPDRGALEAFVVALPLSLGWNSTVRAGEIPHNDGTLSSVVFISRNGLDLED
ncbi:MAG: hypothetical protein ACQGVC_09070 [Myxococcota bacterium]